MISPKLCDSLFRRDLSYLLMASVWLRKRAHLWRNSLKLWNKFSMCLSAPFHYFSTLFHKYHPAWTDISLAVCIRPGSTLPCHWGNVLQQRKRRVWTFRYWVSTLIWQYPAHMSVHGDAEHSDSNGALSFWTQREHLNSFPSSPLSHSTRGSFWSFERS